MTDLVERVAEIISGAIAKEVMQHIPNADVFWVDERSYEAAKPAVRAAIAEVHAPLEARRKQIAGDIARYERELAEFGGTPHVFDPQGLYPRRNLLNALIEEMGGERDDR